MISNTWPKKHDSEAIDGIIAQAIEDAVLLGNVHEIDDVLNLIDDIEDFPEEIRYNLEALRYFRAYYGVGCELEPQNPLQKQKATIMEIAWGAELLDKLRHEGKIVGFGAA